MAYSIIIPIYKEKKNISKLILKVRKELSKKINYELILIDDDSGDGSKKIFEKYKNKNTKFFTRKKKPRDLSRSVIYGFNRAKFNNLIVMDGDLQHSPRDILRLIKKYEKTKCDIVIGSRKLIDYKKSNLTPLRFLLSKMLNQIVNIIFKSNFTDPMSGFFLIKKKVYKTVSSKLILIGYKILMDIVLSSNKNLLVQEVNINFKERNSGFSKMRLKILLQLIISIIVKYLKYKKKY